MARQVQESIYVNFQGLMEVSYNRPASATGFGDIREEDNPSDTIEAVVGENGVEVLLGGAALQEVEPRAAEHFARVVLTFLTKSD